VISIYANSTDRSVGKKYATPNASTRANLLRTQEFSQCTVALARFDIFHIHIFSFLFASWFLMVLRGVLDMAIDMGRLQNMTLDIETRNRSQP